MPTHSLVIEFVACRYDAPPIRDREFVTPLAIKDGECEAAWSWKEHWGGSGVRIVTLESDDPIADCDFDGWAAKAFDSVVRFLKARPVGVFDQLREFGLGNLGVHVDVIYTGDFPIIDWPSDLYDTCRELKIGFT